MSNSNLNFDVLTPALQLPQGASDSAIAAHEGQYKAVKAMYWGIGAHKINLIIRAISRSCNIKTAIKIVLVRYLRYWCSEAPILTTAEINPIDRKRFLALVVQNFQAVVEIYLASGYVENDVYDSVAEALHIVANKLGLDEDSVQLQNTFYINDISFGVKDVRRKNRRREYRAECRSGCGSTDDSDGSTVDSDGGAADTED